MNRPHVSPCLRYHHSTLRAAWILILGALALPRASGAVDGIYHGPSTSSAPRIPTVPERAPKAASSLTSDGHFFVSFEEGCGSDGVPVGRFYSGLTFTNSGGQEWRFIDATTNLYNVHSVTWNADWNSGEYNIHGLVSTWTGVVGDWGRIDFDNQDGTYLQLRYCAASGLTIEAYDASNNLIDTAMGPANLRYAYGAADMGFLRVDAPMGSSIAWVLIHDTGDFWTVDDVAGGFSGVVVNPPQFPSSGAPGNAAIAEPIEDRAGLAASLLGLGWPPLADKTRAAEQFLAAELLYPNACNDRAAGTWTPRPAGVADSLDTYSTVVTDHGYSLEDKSLRERLWHITDGSDTPPGEYDPVLAGARSIWCGKTDPGWATPVGYPNDAYSILYVDTGPHAGPWSLQWLQSVSTELGYDFLHVIGGAGGEVDPIGNSRAALDSIIGSVPDARGELLVTLTGCQTAPMMLVYAPPPGVVITGQGSGSPVTAWFNLSNIPADHRAIYIVFVSDHSVSAEDGLWPSGHGAILDLITTSDNGAIYDDQVAAGATDAYFGDVLVGSSGNPVVSSRVPPGIGELWRISAGSQLPTADFCAPQKSQAQDHMFEAGDAGSHLTIPNTSASIRTCALPVPPGTGLLVASWTEYLDLPRGSGFVQSAEYRCSRNGSWSNWMPVSASGALYVGSKQGWRAHAEEIPGAAQSDSIQIRYSIQCIPALAIDHVNCQQVLYGVMYDDLRILAQPRLPVPAFGIFPGALAQTTFVDGTDPTSVHCLPATISSGACWPGIRGSDAPATAGPIRDNFNSPLGDSIVVSIYRGATTGPAAINWRYGFDRSVGDGRIIAHLNPGFYAAYDCPRVIYRIFDPTTLTWSPFDSSELDADQVQVMGGDPVLASAKFRMNWPPRDKHYINMGGQDIGPVANADLPGAPAWTLNGRTKYSQVRFLPRGTRLQYYFKGVDFYGNRTYQFSSDAQAREVEELPYLPGGSIRAPDIIEFDVLPGKYPAGRAGTLLAGKTDADILNLDGAYTAWNNGFDPVTQALRGMGVRADRYRLLQGLGEGNSIGGHELLNQRVDRLGNYFPNPTEYDIVGLLADAYRIIIQSSNRRTSTIFEEQDALAVESWWNRETGSLPGDGDRCIFLSGDDALNALLNVSLSYPQQAQQVSLAQNVFGVAAVSDAWSNPAARRYPTIDDRFAGGGPGLAPPNTFTYPIDGGCPGPNRFDGLTKIGSADAQNALIYPDGAFDVAGVARMSEKDFVLDSDRNKALAYGFSINFIRTSGIPEIAANYPHSGVQGRMRVLYKFLTSCRRTTGATAPCWPCPSNPAEMITNWAIATGFSTATYGDLYPIQDPALATGVGEEVPGAPGLGNALLQNRPNPFNPETAIPYGLSTAGRAAIRIFDVSGRLVRTLVDKRQEAGPHIARWDGRTDDGRQLGSGIYFYMIFYPDGTTSARKMTIMR